MEREEQRAGPLNMNINFIRKTAKVGEKITEEYAARLLQHAKFDRVSIDVKDSAPTELVILDQACGTGTVSAQLLRMLDDRTRQSLDLTMADIVKPMLDLSEERIQKEGLNLKGMRTIQCDATATKLPSSHFTHILLGFGPMVFADWRAALSEIYRILRPGGILAMSSWGQGGWLPDLQAAMASDPTLPAAPTSKELSELICPQSSWDDPDWCKNTLQGYGFEDIDIITSSRTSVLEGIEEFNVTLPWTLGMVIGKCWSKEQADLDGERAKQTYINYIREKYEHGNVSWDWVANLMTARKPF